MLKLSLDEIVLQILALDLGDPFEFLGSAISPPNTAHVRNAIMHLDALSAVSTENNDSPAECTQKQSPTNVVADYVYSEITPLGFHLAALPVSPRIAKMMLYSVLMACLDPVLTIAAALSTKSPFISPFERREEANEARLLFLTQESDLLTTLAAFEAWKSCWATHVAAARSISRGGHVDAVTSVEARTKFEEDYCARNYLSLYSLQVILNYTLMHLRPSLALKLFVR